MESILQEGGIHWTPTFMECVPLGPPTGNGLRSLLLISYKFVIVYGCWTAIFLELLRMALPYSARWTHRLALVSGHT
eukprot:6466829-Amphidinium_carterae.1